MIETIMGEGGIKVVPDFCLKGLRDLCDEKGILLIIIAYNVDLREIPQIIYSHVLNSEKNLENSFREIHENH